jgi:DNA-binding HxlR family transcriptional regulator
VREWHAGRPERMYGTRRGDRGSGPGIAAGRALDWRAVLEQLRPVRHRWDLAILCHLDDSGGCRPADLLASINAETAGGQLLSPQVLSARLRELERSGYLQHEDLSVMPLRRFYFLELRGQALISDLLAIARPSR